MMLAVKLFVEIAYQIRKTPFYFNFAESFVVVVVVYNELVWGFTK